MFFKMLLMFAAIPVVLWIIYHIQQRLSAEPTRRPVRLLWDLAGAVSLGWWDRLLLIRMTKQARVKDPAVVLLSATCYDRVVGEWLRAGRGEGAVRLKRIRQRLFPG